MNKPNTDNLFAEQYELEAIERIRKFALLSESMGYIPVLGFSGGKDSQVCYDLCKRAGINFRAVFNHCFESCETLNFIRTYYPSVIWRREVKQGFIANIRHNHKGFLPTAEAAYCCADYKHNGKNVDSASIVGVRRDESAKRAARKVLETKNKTILKANKEKINSYFESHCIASGAPSEIQLKPIVDWADEDVWNYINKHNLPINPQYRNSKRIGCIICPKANFTSNYKALLKYPKLIDAIIKARNFEHCDWVITGDNKDYSNDKVYYVCRWLNHSFRPFTPKQEVLYQNVKARYLETKQIQDVWKSMVKRQN